MGIYSFFKRVSIFFLVVLLPACGGGSGDSSPPPRPNISMSPSSLDFTGVVLTNRIEKTLTITNTGNANLTIGQIPNPSPNPTFSIATEACSNVTLSPSERAP